ncbi:hypothetical protein K501DRAFT_68799 [Backusella circina FSU 941]|nr:hypothetical protein K501DRAFT_68799 [Backusella circina FSU 941]
MYLQVPAQCLFYIAFIVVVVIIIIVVTYFPLGSGVTLICGSQISELCFMHTYSMPVYLA